MNRPHPVTSHSAESLLKRVRIPIVAACSVLAQEPVGEAPYLDHAPRWLASLPMTQANPFIERSIRAGSLGGALLAPSDTAGKSLVLIIPGSGPTDQNGNSARALVLKDRWRQRCDAEINS